jgi:hypothetical protein
MPLFTAAATQKLRLKIGDVRYHTAVILEHLLSTAYSTTAVQAARYPPISLVNAGTLSTAV